MHFIIEKIKVAMEKLEKLSEFKLIAGENISLSATESGIIIAAKDLELPVELRRWLIESDSRLSLISTVRTGRGLIYEDSPGESRISVLNDVLPQETFKLNGTGTATERDFPFKVIQLADSPEGYFAAKMLGYNENEKRYFRNYVFAGLESVKIVDEIVFQFNTSSWIYLEITYNGGLWAVAKCANTLPEQTSTYYRVPIAYLHVEDGTLIITQLHYGNVEVTGRII